MVELERVGEDDEVALLVAGVLVDARVLVAAEVVAVVVEVGCKVVENDDGRLDDVTVLVAEVETVEVEDVVGEGVCEDDEENDETLVDVDVTEVGEVDDLLVDEVLAEEVVELEIVVMGRKLRSWATISGFGTGVATVVPREK